MKYANRYGDGRSIFYRKGDNIELEGKYYRIVGIEEVPAYELSFGTVSSGDTSNKFKADFLDPREQDRLVHVLVGVIPVKWGATTPYVSVDYIEEVSCRIRAYRPKEEILWVTPDGNNKAWIDHTISPVDDPNELYPVFVKYNDEPWFEAENAEAHDIDQKIKFMGKTYKLEELSEKPANYAPIAYKPAFRER